ncbi:hypothetical protein FRC11_003426, partial [Ceratobasidium sp. 423]
MQAEHNREHLPGPNFDDARMLHDVVTRREEELTQLGDDLRAMRERDQTNRDRERARRAAGGRHIPPSIQNYLHWLSDDPPRHRDNLELNITELTLGHLEHILQLIAGDLNHEDLAEDPNADDNRDLGGDEDDL